MRGVEESIDDAAAGQRYLVTRSQVLELGGGEDVIKRRLSDGRWKRRHAGVYQVDRRSPDWEAELMAAVLACGPGGLVSHRAALVLWKLDGLYSAPIELTVPYDNRPLPEGAIVHRTRRPRTPALLRGIPVTTVERTILDCSSMFGPLVVGKALDSALRRRLTSMEKVYDMLVAKGGRGVKGTKTLRWVLRDRLHDTATGSGAEFELLYHMQMAFLRRPELQYPLFADGRRVPDFYWPDLGKAVEVDGVDAHSSADRLDDDLKRQNALMDLGVELRRFSAREIRRNPKRVVAQIRQFLES